MIWVLQKLKVITSGPDSKSNERSNLHEALLLLTKMQQGGDESDDNLMKIVKANIDTLTSAGGEHILCSGETIMDKVGTEPTDSERKIKEENFKAVMFLKQSDKLRHKKLITDLQDGAYVGKNEYPTTLV